LVGSEEVDDIPIVTGRRLPGQGEDLAVINEFSAIIKNVDGLIGTEDMELTDAGTIDVSDADETAVPVVVPFEQNSEGK
jgi:hypothetical protein